MRQKLEAVRGEKARFARGGGDAAVEEQHRRGKLTARERIARLLDPGSFQELDMLLSGADNPFDPGATPPPSDAVVTGFGQIEGRPVFVWAQDATVLRGTLGVVGAKKITQTIEKALIARAPVIGIIDSEGERAGDFMAYPAFYSLGSICNAMVKCSGVVPQVALVMGPCPEGLALVANLADFVIMARASYMHVGPLPEGMSGEQLGDARTHSRRTGCCDILADDDDDCIQKCRVLLGYLPSHTKQRPPRADAGDDPDRREEDLLDIVPPDEAKPFDMRRLISLVVDRGQFFELKRTWAANLITGFTRLDGQTVGILANNPMDKGGCMDLDASDKMARFVLVCDAYNIPLVWLADCPAFLPSLDEEKRGIIRHGSKAVFANTLATVPQITLVVRKLYGGGGLVMPGTRLGGDLFAAWPTISRGLMGPEGAVSILYKKELDGIADKDAREAQRALRVAELKEKLELTRREGAQEIIDPRETRAYLIKSLAALGAKEKQIPGRMHDNMRL